MSIELLTKTECDLDVKELIENIDSLTADKDLYSIIIEKQLVKA